MLAAVSDADPKTPATAGRSIAPLLLGVAAIGAFALHEALEVARAEWFSRDDFALLLYVQRPWSWLDAFLPIERGFWWTYRPLGMDAFFRLAFQAFGLDAFRWFAVELAVHAALGPATFLLARRLGFERPAAVTAGALAVLASPSLGGLYYASVFHYVAANLLGAIALLFFHAGLHSAAWLPRIGAAVAFAAALLCNESALVIPGVAALLAVRSSGASRRLGAVAMSVAPLCLLAAIYLVLRFGVFELADPPAAYTPRFRGNLLRHFWMQPMWLAGGRGRLVIALVSMGAILGAAVHAARAEPAPLRRLLRDYALLLPWLLAAIAVFAMLPFSHSRFAITLQLPGALLVGAHLDAVWRSYGARLGTTLQAGFVVLLLLALPQDAMRQRAASPWGGPARDFVEGIGRIHPRLPPGTELRVLHGGDELASRAQMERVRRLTYGGSAIKVVRHAERLGAVRFVEVAAARREPRCARCAYVALGPDLKIRPAPPL